MASNFKRTPFTLADDTPRLFQCVCFADRHVSTHTIILPLPAASQGKITLGPSVTMGGGRVGPHLPFQPLHKREEEITEDPRTLIQQMRKHSHRRGASMDSFLAPHRLEERGGEGVDVGWYVSCREIPLNLSPHLLLWEFPILAALTENQMRCYTLNLS